MNWGPDSGVSHAVSSAQDRVLAVLADRNSPTTLAELTEATGLHENTLRGHLDALHTGGHLTRYRATPRGRGRPAWSYVARESPYVALAQALARGLETNRGGTAWETGESGGLAWGERLRDLFAQDAQAPRERLLLVLEHVGFSPEPSADGTSVRLTRCPFVDAAHSHPEAVCSVHLGLIEGALGETLDRAALKPFAEPDACLVRLGVPVTVE